MLLIKSLVIIGSSVDLYLICCALNEFFSHRKQLLQRERSLDCSCHLKVFIKSTRGSCSIIPTHTKLALSLKDKGKASRGSCHND